MSNDRITVVCGFGRCGTSLLMQMLAAGGMAVHGEYPAYEDPAARGGNSALFDTLPGKAIKLLDEPALHSLSGCYLYDFVWLDRNEREQAFSACKLLAAAGHPLPRGAAKVLTRSYWRSRPGLLAHLRALLGSRLLRLRFEDVLAEPLRAAETLIHFLGQPQLDRYEMVEQVRPRSPKCYPGLLELSLLDRAAPPSASTRRTA